MIPPGEYELIICEPCRLQLGVSAATPKLTDPDAFGRVFCKHIGPGTGRRQPLGLRGRQDGEKENPMDDDMLIAAAAATAAKVLLVRVKDRLHLRADEIDRQAMPADEPYPAETPAARVLREVAGCIGTECSRLEEELTRARTEPPTMPAET